MPEGASGLVIVDKPSGWTSHQVVARCRRIYGTRKVGHAGTLDPMATGVLLVGVNRATRLLGHLAGHDKSYRATIRLGIDTVTDDAEGEVTQTRGANQVTEAAVRAAIGGFVGTISQVPAAVSAIKVDGKRAYARVRAGEQVELRARDVTVSGFQLLSVSVAEVDAVPVLDLEVSVDCSSGTYIRALARDLGQALSSGGHLTALRRTRVGQFDLSGEVLTSAELDNQTPVELLGLGAIAERSFPVIRVSEAQARDVSFGRSLDLVVESDPTALLDADGELLALYRPGTGNHALPVSVFTSA